MLGLTFYHNGRTVLINRHLLLILYFCLKCLIQPETERVVFYAF